VAQVKHIKAIVLRAAGTNCDLETQHGLELAGAQAERVHINHVIENPQVLAEYQMFVVPGGFSYGDDVAAGRILANQLIHHLADPLRRFVEDGNCVLGICNGFQVLLKAGLLMSGGNRKHTATLTLNDSGKFEDRWVHVSTTSNVCVYLKPGQLIYLPIAHAEGKFMVRDAAALNAIVGNDQVALRYVDAAGQRGEYPVNPNGSIDDIAGVCDPSGRVLGLMPHPERFVSATHHPQWTRAERELQIDGLALLRNGVEYLRENR